MKLIFSLLFVIASYSSWLSAQPEYPIANIMIFGDSLSDSGNFPQAPKPFIYNKALPAWHHLSPMFYVPVANPVNRLPGSFAPPLNVLFHTSHKYVWPNLSLDHLSAQASHRFASLSWTEFLLSFAHQDGLVASPVIYPWAHLAADPNSVTHYSVDYAWATATSFDRCNYFKGYQKVPDHLCNRPGILAARQAYQHHPSAQNYLNLIVPGVRKQVELFIEDVKSRRVKVNQNTCYIIYVGGNDLLDDYERMVSGHPAKILAGLANMVYWDSHDVYKAALTLMNNPAIDARHIYIVNLFNPGLTPAVYQQGKLAAKGAQLVDHYYNHELRVTVKDLKWYYPKRTIKLVDAHHWFQQMATDPLYQVYQVFDPAKLHQACELSDAAYTHYSTPKANCRGYLFWNSIHPTMAAQAIFAYRLEQLLSKQN
jgi:phospholipase/lecithinase/hemolysin